MAMEEYKWIDIKLIIHIELQKTQIFMETGRKTCSMLKEQEQGPFLKG
jgi:hypothetical protein